MPKKTVKGITVDYKITKVNITKDSSVDSYPAADDVSAVINGLKKLDEWTMDFDVNDKKPEINRVSGIGYPVVDRHPGHVHSASKGWKYNIDEGTGSVDRLVLSDCKAEVKKQVGDKPGKKINNVEVEVSIKVKVLEDTH
jgi:hypothetical protein